jgi:MAP/microtubule affinity-regulating kinase
MTEYGLVIGNYKLGNYLGRGAYACVRAGICQLTGREVAIKIVDRSHLQPRERARIAMEVSILKQLRHSNITELIEVYWPIYVTLLAHGVL